MKKLIKNNFHITIIQKKKSNSNYWQKKGVVMLLSLLFRTFIDHGCNILVSQSEILHFFSPLQRTGKKIS